MNLEGWSLRKARVNTKAFRGNPFGIFRKQQGGQVGTEGREVARRAGPWEGPWIVS